MFVAWFASTVYYFLQIYQDNVSAVAPLSWYHLIVAVFVLFVSTPLLLIIRHYAKQENMKSIKILSTIGIVQHVIWVVLGFIQWSIR